MLVGPRRRRLGGDAELPGSSAFSGRTREDALAWCLVWLVALEIGVGPFLVQASDHLASITGVAGR